MSKFVSVRPFTGSWTESNPVEFCSLSDRTWTPRLQPLPYLDHADFSMNLWFTCWKLALLTRFGERGICQLPTWLRPKFTQHAAHSGHGPKFTQHAAQMIKHRAFCPPKPEAREWERDPPWQDIKRGPAACGFPHRKKSILTCWTIVEVWFFLLNSKIR
jgi:hypothetical protein